MNTITRQMQIWNVTQDVTEGDGELSNGTTIDMTAFIFYCALGTVLFMISWQLYLKWRDSASIVPDIPEPPATLQGQVAVKRSAAERRKELLAGFQEHKVQREVSKGDLKASDDGDDSCEQDIENGLGLLVIPGRVSPQTETVPNNCAICLESYEPGETVVWSGNPKCNHAYHQGCIMACLVKVKDGSTPCPMCRQDFTSDPWSEAVCDKKIELLPQ